MSPLDLARIVKARHFIRFMDFYVWLYGRFRFGTLAQRLVTRLSRAVCGPVPYVLKIDLSHQCNLHCDMCYSSHDERKMSLDQFKQLITPLKGVGCRLDLMGGEPFLYQELEQAIAFARGEVGAREVIVYTNGTQICREKATAVKAAGLTRAMVNLGSHDEAKHDRFTGVAGSWRATLRGIEALKQAGVDTSPFVVVHRHNVADCAAMIRFAEQELGAAPVFFQFVPRHQDDELMPSRDDWDQAKRLVLYGDQRGRKHAATVAKLMTLCGRDCLGGYFSYSVKVNGDVAPCPFIHDLVLGNALEDGLWSVFLRRMDSARFRAFSDLPRDCRGCSHAGACGGGCRAGQLGDYSRRDQRCLGPWHEPVDHDRLFERLPTFF